MALKCFNRVVRNQQLPKSLGLLRIKVLVYITSTLLLYFSPTVKKSSVWQPQVRSCFCSSAWSHFALWGSAIRRLSAAPWWLSFTPDMVHTPFVQQNIKWRPNMFFLLLFSYISILSYCYMLCVMDYLQNLNLNDLLFVLHKKYI